ncbi:MAG: NAD(P)-binding protein [Rhizobiales bacterium]|nr:NAD(P)-binding protein [Hyphomicrobiales bacterium]
MPRTFHVIGAGLAGLSAAVRLAGAGYAVTVHEAAPHAGGRCRSYYDQTLGMVIDNGNHLVLSGNRATLDYLRTIGSADRLVGPPTAAVDFVDLATGQRWTLRPNDGRLPWWIFDAGRRIPGTVSFDYLPAARLMWASASQRIDAVLSCRGRVYERLLHPFLLAALNTEPPAASAALAGAVIRETLAAGGAACRPLIARDGLGAALIDPALRVLERQHGTICFGHRLRAVGIEGDRIESLDFGEDSVPLGPQDAAVLAVPPPVAAALVPELSAPTEFRAIVNAHFRLAPPADLPPLIGVVNGTVEWIFSFPDRISVTISGADRLLDAPREELAGLIWREVSQVAKLAEPMPPWQIVRERRATFAATPEQDARRPGPRTPWKNLALAGDWTATGLPATIEGAIRSGNLAAETIAV